MTKSKTPSSDQAEHAILSVRVPGTIRDELDAFCAESEHTRSQVVRLALSAYLARQRQGGRHD